MGQILTLCHFIIVSVYTASDSPHFLLNRLYRFNILKLRFKMCELWTGLENHLLLKCADDLSRDKLFSPFSQQIVAVCDSVPP